jgi:hypothetical protein
MGSKFKEAKFYPECSRCGAKMGICTRLEYEAFLDGNRLCFDCENFEASLYPEFWQEITSGSIVIIDKKPFFYEDGLWKQETFFHARARGARSRLSLSSSTYLNRSVRNSVFLKNGLDVSLCPVCLGSLELENSGQVEPCYECQGLGTVAIAIVLPLWLIQEGANNV